MTNPYDEDNDVIPCRLWAVSEENGLFEAEARLLVPSLIHVSSMSHGAEATMRKLESALRALGFTGQLEWRTD